LINNADPREHSNTTLWIDMQKRALPTLMHGLRRIALKWWKRHVTLLFCKWLDNQFVATKKPTSEALVEWQGDWYVWARKGKQSYISWHLWRERAFVKNLKVARDTIEERTSKSSWWSWDDGSTPLFWRWPAEYMVRIRDGVPVYFQREPPRNLKPQRGETKTDVRELVRNKLEKYWIEGTSSHLVW
jgi:hypothetical protein